ncbi:MAG TPA: hydantoinase/oxoprolinase family protein [Chloroflexota bacterium]|nr:hydantoinase/oxoprolinase family protein [Chloroflexota bacterium]HZU04410.1 hydantoinase/oxoprolinase family protein [Chloroflexota bacterium]
MEHAARRRVGIDVGGTFTDLLLVDDATGEVTVGKELTTPAQPAEGVERVLATALQARALAPAALDRLIHGTTLVTNTIIERKGARTALLTTRGFRDAVEIGREHRYDLYDLFLEMPRPLVPRYLRFEVPERILADGSIREPLDEAYVERLVRELACKGVEALAVAFLHSYRNPAHEQAVAQLVARVAPHLRVALSSEVAPELREYERTSTTCANVYVQALVERYLRDLAQRLAQQGFAGQFFVMLSSGGLATIDTAIRFPIRLLESGPAAGALAAAYYGREAGLRDLLSFDMGGTTAKLCVITGGEPHLASEFEVDRVYRFKRGSGLPIRAPVIEMVEIGAGGGSIARVDSLGLLKVGPESAGADPGPACYGRGGTAPTVTDADLLLGYLNPDYFLGGRLRLHRAAAEAALTPLARQLGLSLAETAWGIHQVANESMAGAARIHIVERGRDPRGLPILAFGGAGPVHSDRVARLLHAPALIVPFGAGVTSALGFLVAPLAFDFARSYFGRLDELPWETVNALLAGMEAEGRALLTQAGLLPTEITVRRWADLRYVGQGHEIRVALPDGPLSAELLPQLRARFEETYQRLYRRAGPRVGLEALHWRVQVSGPQPLFRLRLAAGAEADSRRALKGRRPAYFPEGGGFVDTPVYDRYRLGPGATFEGPAIVEEQESTLVVGPGAWAEVDPLGNVVVRWKHGG